MFLRTFVLTVMLVTLAACGGGAQPAASGDGADEPTQHDMNGQDADGHGGDFAFGRPADAADADRTIDITTSNDLVFDPPQVTVSEGETVTFSLSNNGDLAHDFVIGDEAAQTRHAEEMDHGAEAHGDANTVSIPPGETVELTWVFDGETDGLLYGCHEPGHYAAGMVGEIVVES